MQAGLFKAILLSLFSGIFLIPAQPPEDVAGSGAIVRRSNDPVAPAKPQPAENAVNWRAVIQQSAMFTGVQHAFRLGTEPGTRSGLNGPFW